MGIAVLQEALFLILILGIPVSSLAYFVISLGRFIGAKAKKGKEEPSDDYGSRLKNRRIHLIISSILLGVVITVYGCGFIMLAIAVSHM